MENIGELERRLQVIKKDLEQIKNEIKLKGKSAEEQHKYHKLWCEKRIKDIEGQIEEANQENIEKN